MKQTERNMWRLRKKIVTRAVHAVSSYIYEHKRMHWDCSKSTFSGGFKVKSRYRFVEFKFQRCDITWILKKKQESNENIVKIDFDPKIIIYKVWE